MLDHFILPSDVVIVPVERLPPEVRDQIEHADGDCSVTRPQTRLPSSIVDARTAALLERFRTPTTIVDAVIGFSAAAGVDPRNTLNDAFGVLGSFVNNGLLVSPDSEFARSIDTTLVPGDAVGRFDVVAAVEVVVDTEVHLARSPDGEDVAVKMARPGSEERMRRTFAHEAGILASLDGRVTPRLLGAGELDGRPFLAMSWCPGVDVYEAAAEARRLAGSPAALALAERVLDAYARLHAQGVLHGDVHTRNALVDGDGAVTIVDFGLAGPPSRPGTVADGGRGGVDFFMEPEVARARRRGAAEPALSAAGEQYSVAALLYLLLTGAHTHAFAPEEEEMLRQLVDDPPLPLEHHGVRDLPRVARVLERALAKQPDARYPSLLAMLRAIQDAAATDLAAAYAREPSPRVPGPAQRLLDAVLARLAAPGGELFAAPPSAPSASVQNGAAGFAYALLRVAGVRGDETLLGQADLWSLRAALESPKPGAFWSQELEIVPETFGENSLHHTVTGVHAVASLVAGARGDDWSQTVALAAFIDAASRPCDHFDVVFGRAGILLGCALLIEALPSSIDDASLRRLGAELSAGLEAQIAPYPEIGACGEQPSLGAAHGWAGVLFAILRWCEAIVLSPPGAIMERLGELGALGCPGRRGTVWSHNVGAPPAANPIAAGWCSGAAGYVPLWTLAHRLTGDDAFARLAVGAAWTAYEDPADTGDLCCGLAGRAYALLNLYRHGAGDVWLARARDLADRAALSVRRDALRRDSLYKGEIGVALLAADLDDPLHSCLPLYEGEGWPRRAQPDDPARPRRPAAAAPQRPPTRSRPPPWPGERTPRPSAGGPSAPSASPGR